MKVKTIDKVTGEKVSVYLDDLRGLEFLYFEVEESVSVPTSNITNTLEKAIQLFGDKQHAEDWFYNKTLKQFGGMSPYEMVIQGGEEEVICLMERIGLL